jgi:hypothetical protein
VAIDESGAGCAANPPGQAAPRAHKLQHSSPLLLKPAVCGPPHDSAAPQQRQAAASMWNGNPYARGRATVLTRDRAWPGPRCVLLPRVSESERTYHSIESKGKGGWPEGRRRRWRLVAEAVGRARQRWEVVSAGQQWRHQGSRLGLSGAAGELRRPPGLEGWGAVRLTTGGWWAGSEGAEQRSARKKTCGGGV